MCDPKTVATIGLVGAGIATGGFGLLLPAAGAGGAGAAAGAGGLFTAANLATAASALGAVGQVASAFNTVKGAAKGPAQAQQAAIPAPAPEAPPQAATAPDANVFKKKGLPGVDPTALTGPSGVSNTLLTLGKATLLGS